MLVTDMQQTRCQTE